MNSFFSQLRFRCFFWKKKCCTPQRKISKIRLKSLQYILTTGKQPPAGIYIFINLHLPVFYSTARSAFSHIHFVLTESERQNYLSQLIDSAKNGCKIFILNDTNPVLDRGNIELSLYLSSHNMFFIPHENSASEKFYYSEDANTIHCFQDMLEKLCNLDNSFIIKDPDTIQLFCKDMLY